MRHDRDVNYYQRKEGKDHEQDYDNWAGFGKECISCQAIDSKLRRCDLLKIRVKDVSHGGIVSKRTMIVQQKTQQPVQFEITKQTRDAISNWVAHARLSNNDHLFKSSYLNSPHISTRQNARIAHAWISEIDLDTATYGTHSLKRTKESLIYRRTNNIRAIQLLPEAYKTGEYSQISGY